MPQSNADKRLILTFPTLHQVLAAERALRESGDSSLRCRPTPTPPGLSESICGMAIEIFAKEEQEKAIEFLRSQNLSPAAVTWWAESITLSASYASLQAVNAQAIAS